jgi:membrane associated rhomboid family serine protease
MSTINPGVQPPKRSAIGRASSGIAAVLGCVAVMWVVEIVDSVALDDRLQGGGIHPRDLGGLDGVLWSPVLHAGFGHLISNTIPFVMLGLLVMTHGRVRWLQVMAGTVALGGFATWVFARGGNHIGASGVVFGFLGYLITAGFAARSVKAMLTGFLAVVMFGTVLLGVLPSPGVSWESHLFGGLAGALMAKILGSPAPSRRSDRPNPAPATDSRG